MSIIAHLALAVIAAAGFVAPGNGLANPAEIIRAIRLSAATLHGDRTVLLARPRRHP